MAAPNPITPACPLIRPFQLDKPVTRVTTDNKFRKVWEYLRRFQHVGYTASLLASQNPESQRTDWNDKASDIAVCINQAEAFYQSAASSALRIKPLLLYYGMLALAKALIIAGDNPFRLTHNSPSDQPATSHGLTIQTPSAQDKAARQGTEISSEFCYYRGGLFKQLRQCYSRTPIPWSSKVELSWRFEIKDLLSLLPDDWEKFCDYFPSLPPNVARVKDDWYGVGDINGAVLGGHQQHVIGLDLISAVALNDAHRRRSASTSADCLTCLEPIFIESGYLSVPNAQGWFVRPTPCITIDDNIVVARDSAGDAYALISPFPFNVCDIDVHYIIMFILSNLVRYHPAKWTRLSSFVGTDELYLIEGFVETSMVRFPNLILNELSCRHYDFVLSVGR